MAKKHKITREHCACGKFAMSGNGGRCYNCGVVDKIHEEVKTLKAEIDRLKHPIEVIISPQTWNVTPDFLKKLEALGLKFEWRAR